MCVKYVVALAIGLVREVVPADRLMDRAHEFAREIAAGPPVAIEITKRLAHDGLARDLDTQILAEQLFVPVTGATEDAAEGRRSFFEKREPQFRGR